MRYRRYEDDDPPPRREKPSGDLKHAAWGATTAAARLRGQGQAEGDWRPELPEMKTAGQRRRFRRNLIIALAHRNGLSSRFIADALGLARSQVSEVIEQMGKFRPA